MRLKILFLFIASVALLTSRIHAHVEDEDDEAKVETEDDDVIVTSTETINSEADDVLYISPESHPDVFLAEHFDEENEEDFYAKWIKSQAKKDDAEEAIAKYDGVWSLEQAEKDPLTGDKGLVMKSKAKHSAIAAKLKKPFPFDEKPLIVQYELNFQHGQDCGGGYIKLLSHKKGLDLRQFTDKTPYTIMFGPDKCGSDAKLHFIFRHINPKNQSVEEKHCKKLGTKERSDFEEYLRDKRPHLYRLIVRPDNTFEMSIDYKIVNHGSLMDDFNPPVNPPAEIDDPKDKKPSDWDEREKIPDPKASKPDDWDEDAPRSIVDESAVMPTGWLEDEPEMVPDIGAEKPDDWDDEMDGEWEAPLVENPRCQSAPGCGKWNKPMIDNPKYKGKWHAQLIDNPEYKGKWKPRRIPNPDYYHDPEPFKMTAIGAVGIELWSMSQDIYFDNLLITDEKSIADKWSAETFDLKVQKLDSNDAGMFRRILNYSNRNPWLYAVYVVVVGLPLVLIVTFCCSSDTPAVHKKTGDSGNDEEKPKKNGKNKLNQHPKKTDEVQEDDEVEEEEEEDEEEEDEDEDDEEQDEEEVEEVKEEPQLKQRKSARTRKARKD